MLVAAVMVLLVAALVTIAYTRTARRRGVEVEAPPAPLPPPTPVPPAAAAPPPPRPAEEPSAEVAEAPEGPREPPRLRDRLGRTRAALAGYVRDIGGRKVDESTWEELEEALILADVGLTTTGILLAAVRERVDSEKVADADGVVAILRDEIASMLNTGADRTLARTPGEANVWMFVGVNGVGKTTTIGKLAAQQVGEGHRVVLAAADTFRAAAAEQLTLWGERVGAEVVRGQEGADPGSIVFDAMAAASSRSADVVLVDTAGRLHTKANLMQELTKLRRIVERTEGACKEVLLVIDATTGQNGLTQARLFAEAVDVTGIVLTKLDGTAKGGIVLAIQGELGIPVKVVGVGEGVDDLVAFDPDEFAAALFE